MKTWIISLIVAVLGNEQVQAAIITVVDKVFTDKGIPEIEKIFNEKVLPAIPVAAAAAAKAATDEIVAKLPEVEQTAVSSLGNIVGGTIQALEGFIPGLSWVFPQPPATPPAPPAAH